MKNFRLLLLFIFTFVLHNRSECQTLAHFKLGQETFSNTDIYSILSTDDDQLFVATNDGIFEFRYNKFQRLPVAKGQKGNSFFNLKTNNSGQIFCQNLRGQIFNIEHSNVDVYHEIPTSERVNQPDFYFDENGNLLVFAKNFYRLSSDKKVDTIYNIQLSNEPFSSFFRPMQMLDGTIIASLISDRESKLLTYKNGTVETLLFNEIKWNGSNSNPRGSVSGFQFGTKLIYRTEYDVFSSNIRVEMNDNGRQRINQLNDSLLLSIDNKNGINFWKYTNNKLVQGNKLFPNTFISSYSYSSNGTLLLGTFGEGIIVIPNIHVVETEANTSLRGIDVNNGVVYIGSREGSLFEYKDSLRKIDIRELNIDDIFKLDRNYDYLPEKNILVSYGSLPAIPIIKDVSEGEQGFFFASNKGLLYSSEDLSNKEISRFENAKSTNKNVRFLLKNKRYTKLAYNKTKHEIYFSDHNNVLYIKGKSKINELLYFNEPINCNDLKINEGKLFIATPDNGILVYENHKLIKEYAKFDGLNSQNAKKIKIKDDILFVLTDKGLQAISLSQNRIVTLSSINGVMDNLISNFSVDEENIWVLKASSFYNIPIRSISFEQPDLRFKIDSVMVANARVDFAKDIRLGSDQQTFLVYIDFKDFTRARDAKIEYRLDDEPWQSYSASQNKITIQNYAYGRHTLKIRLRHSQKTFDTKTIKFNVLPPIYLRWWFYPIILLLIVGIIILFFRRKLQLQAKEARRVNELNSSKLTAIQSQMNPHFVFNALNSIQHLVISGDTDNAYNYITQFANLVRRTLDYSDKDRISIFQEIKLLEVYLELEKLRFKVDFHYSFEKKNIKDVQIPPMLIQPFIENALVHGLMHKEGVKNLNVYLELFDDYLLCRVEDNGIGRVEAKKIRHRQRGDHKSFALNAINNRFRILNEYSDEKLGYEYEDFPVDNEKVSTRVTLKIPIK